jgi:hypothetical protein
MKKTAKKRLALGRETVKVIAELATDGLRGIAGAREAQSGTLETMSPGPTYGCSGSCGRCPC